MHIHSGLKTDVLSFLPSSFTFFITKHSQPKLLAMGTNETIRSINLPSVSHFFYEFIQNIYI